MPLTAVTFDAAGTLFAPREAVGLTYARVAGGHGIALDPATTERRFREAMRAAPPLAFPGIPPATRRRSERDWWRSVVRAAFGTAAGSPEFASCFDALLDHYARAGAWVVDEGATDTLTTLRKRGLRTAIVSNFDSRLDPLLDGLGLAPLVDRVVTSVAHDVAKPDPRIFAIAACLLDARPADVAHVGDDAEADVGGALAAGCRAILLSRVGATAPRGVPTLRRLRDLPGVL